MTRKPIITKQQMYQLLQQGKLGNTIPQFLSVADWLADPSHLKYQFWGVRSATVSGHPACRLNCPQAEVVAYAQKHFPQQVNISLMVDKITNINAWLEIGYFHDGLTVEGIEYPDTSNGWTWRSHMPNPSYRRQWRGLRAWGILRKHLNENSYDDLFELLAEYPNHIVELSALPCCLGTHEHRNAVIWEVRMY